MNCPFCGKNTKVTNSRTHSTRVWRRRTCERDHLLTTYESVDLSQINVVKRDGALEPLQTTKILMSLARCEIEHDSAVALQQTIIDRLFTQLSDSQELSSKTIAATIYEVLVAYDERYANRYRSYSAQLED